jgi:hypothetical protein
MHIKTNLIICILLLLLLSFCKKEIFPTESENIKFNRRKWLKDTLCCNGYREKHWGFVLNQLNKGILKGKDTTTIIRYIGQPDNKGVKWFGYSWTYYIQVCEHCYPPYEENHECMMMVLEFDSTAILERAYSIRLIID